MKRASASRMALGAALLVAWPASAQTFPPDAQWVALTHGGVVLGDPTGDANGSRDIVGDAANPAAFTYFDGTFLYFRLRVDEDPKQNPNDYRQFGWGVVFETDGDPTGYEYLAMLDGIANPDVVTLEQNTNQATPNAVRDPAEVVLATYDVNTHAQSMQTSSTFNGNPDFFVDWAVTLSDLTAAGFDPARGVRYVFGTSNAAHTLDDDILAPPSVDTIDGGATDPIRWVGTTPEICNTAAACGVDCVPCGGATPYCDGARCVQCTLSSHCPPTAPTCDPTGTCVAGGGCTTDADCTNPAQPACQPDGSCGECSATNQTLCGPGEQCNVAAGVCTGACTTDADCTDPAQPACQPSGQCGECSATNQSVCAARGQQCDVAAGVCIAGAVTCTTDADCANPAFPACGPAGVCTECSATNPGVCPGLCDVNTGLCSLAAEGSGCSLGDRGTAGWLTALGAFAALFGLLRRRSRADRG